MRHYLCRVYSSHEYAPIDYAYVGFDDELRRFIASVVPKIAAMADLGHTLLRVEFLHYGPIFMESLPAAFEEYEDTLNCGEMVLLPDDGPVIPAACGARLEFGTIQVEDDGFRWTCRPKHTPCEYETLTFRYKDIGWPELDVRDRG